MDNGKRFKNNINSAVAFDRIRGKIKNQSLYAGRVLTPISGSG